MIYNVQERFVAAPIDVVGPFLDELATPGAGIWPAPAWPPLRLDRGLAVGSRGGHGPIRYGVAGYEPARRAHFTFSNSLGVGYHEFAVGQAPGGTTITHVISLRSRGRMALAWPLAVRWLHEALLQDLLDNWERAATGTVRNPNRWSPWVRLIRRAIRVRGARRARRAQRTASSQSRA